MTPERLEELRAGCPACVELQDRCSKVPTLEETRELIKENEKLRANLDRCFGGSPTVYMELGQKIVDLEEEQNALLYAIQELEAFKEPFVTIGMDSPQQAANVIREYATIAKTQRERAEKAEAENKKLRDFIEVVKEFDPRSDTYANGLRGDCNEILGLCRCCGEKECEEE